MTSTKLDVISLFSGAGGLDFGAERAGAKIIYSNDNSPEACSTIRAYFPSIEVIEGDISDIKSFPKADLVMGGYPCQSFSMGGNRDPKRDKRTFLYQDFARCLEEVQPMYFVAENVDGLQKLMKGHFLEEQVKIFRKTGREGYRITAQRLDAKDYGVPQTRKRMFIVGVRNDLEKVFVFPSPTHGKKSNKPTLLNPFTSHGEAIRHLPLWPRGEFYERPHDPEGHWSWYFMSRKRKGPWSGPSYTIVANWRHITLHPAGPVMKLTWSDLKNNWKQRWDFSDEYEHLSKSDPDRPVLKEPRRLSWRECALIQTFPDGFEPHGSVESKFTQIGNAVPPMLAEAVLGAITTGKGLKDVEDEEVPEGVQLALWK